MTDMIIKVMVEVLDILGIATKEMKQSRASEAILLIQLLEAHVSLEKILKKVAGITKLENALKNLDKMINEEVPIVIAEMLKVIYSVNKRVEMVDEKVQIGIEGAHTVLTSPQTSLLKII